MSNHCNNLKKFPFVYFLIPLCLITSYKRTESHTRPHTVHTHSHMRTRYSSHYIPLFLISCVTTVFKSKCLSASNNSTDYFLFNNVLKPIFLWGFHFTSTSSNDLRLDLLFLFAFTCAGLRACCL